MVNVKKLERYLKENKISPLYRSSKVEKFIVEGDTGVWTIRHDLQKNAWSCNCKNIRLQNCVHIECCKVKYGKL